MSNETQQSPRVDKVSGSTKVQNKIVHFVESQSKFSKSRTEFCELNKKYRSLTAEQRP